MILRVDFETYADTCDEIGVKRVQDAMALADYTLCNCQSLPFLDLERLDFSLDITNDRRELTRQYTRFRQSWQAKTILYACEPGSVPIGCR